MLRKAGLGTPEGVVAGSAAEASAAAARLGFPVAVKIASADIAHKSDIGGVILGVRTAPAVEQAFDRVVQAAATHCPEARVNGALVERMMPSGGIEILLSVSRDPVLGHVMTCGLGGIHVELLRDVSRRLLPVDAVEAARMLRDLRGYPLLSGSRGAVPCDLGALCRAMAALSALVEGRPEDFDEIEINPLRLGVRGEGAWALDAVVTVRSR